MYGRNSWLVGRQAGGCSVARLYWQAETKGKMKTEFQYQSGLSNVGSFIISSSSLRCHIQPKPLAPLINIRHPAGLHFSYLPCFKLQIRCVIILKISGNIQGFPHPLFFNEIIKFCTRGYSNLPLKTGGVYFEPSDRRRPTQHTYIFYPRY